MANIAHDVLKAVGRHFFFLSCVQVHQGTRAHPVFSGFLVEVLGSWFLITAGHLMRYIRLAQEAGDTFNAWRLDDQTARGGAEPIRKNAWGDYLQEHDHWALVGVPAESVVHGGRQTLTGKFALIPLKRTAPPADVGSRTDNQFYGKISEMGNVKDLQGMSGGPIFSLKKVDGSWTYHVIGVQSGWYSESKVAAACPITSLLFEVEKVVGLVREKLGYDAPDGTAGLHASNSDRAIPD